MERPTDPILIFNAARMLYADGEPKLGSLRLSVRASEVAAVIDGSDFDDIDGTIVLRNGAQFDVEMPAARHDHALTLTEYVYGKPAGACVLCGCRDDHDYRDHV